MCTIKVPVDRNLPLRRSWRALTLTQELSLSFTYKGYCAIPQSCRVLCIEKAPQSTARRNNAWRISQLQPGSTTAMWKHTCVMFKSYRELFCLRGGKCDLMKEGWFLHFLGPRSPCALHEHLWLRDSFAPIINNSGTRALPTDLLRALWFFHLNGVG